MIEFDCREALKHPGSVYRFAYDGTPDFEGVVFEKPLVLQATYSCTGDDVRVDGTFDAVRAMECSRCLAPVTYPIHVDFSEIFYPDDAENDDLDAYTYNRETNRVSLDQMAFDAIEAQTPIRVLCSEDCKGLCPVCGQNLNEGQCACQNRQERDEYSDSPFAKLKDLF